MNNKKCQLYDLAGIAKPLHIGESIYQRRKRVKRIIKRRLRYVQNVFSEITGREKELLRTSTEASTKILNLKPGELVRIKSRDEIQNTLNRWNALKGCAFMEEMWQYCGTTHRVFKRVNQFLDERTYLVRKCKGIVLLEGVICHGTKDFGPCDRSCFLFWREEWLEKIDTE
jgi:hypothetical protein